MWIYFSEGDKAKRAMMARADCFVVPDVQIDSLRVILLNKYTLNQN